MHRIFRVKAYEAEHGPHFNEEHARKAVSKMENEDGTRGPHPNCCQLDYYRYLLNRETTTTPAA